MFELKFSTDNAAFTAEATLDSECAKRIEIRRILKEIGEAVTKGEQFKAGIIRDINGNKIGEWKLK